jgi:solute carrier family 44 (choline transporter-like protein), member 2/4/5
MYEYGSYAVFGFTAFSFLVLIFQRNNIRLAIAIIKTAALYVKDTPLAMLVPPIFTLIVAAWWSIWIVGFIFLYSWGEFFKNDYSFFG